MPREILMPRADLFCSLKMYRKQLLGLRYANYFNRLKDYFLSQLLSYAVLKINHHQQESKKDFFLKITFMKLCVARNTVVLFDVFYPPVNEFYDVFSGLF